MRYPLPSQPLDVYPFDVQGLTAGAELSSKAGWLWGYTMRNTDPVNPAALDLYDGSTDNGALLGSWSIPAGATLVQRPSPGGWPFESGLFANVTAGTVTIVVVIGVTA